MIATRIATASAVRPAMCALVFSTPSITKMVSSGSRPTSADAVRLPATGVRSCSNMELLSRTLSGLTGGTSERAGLGGAGVVSLRHRPTRALVLRSGRRDRVHAADRGVEELDR